MRENVKCVKSTMKEMRIHNIFVVIKCKLQTYVNVSNDVLLFYFSFFSGMRDTL